MITHLAIVIVADVCIVKICDFLLRHALSPNPKYVVVLRDLQGVLIETSYDETDTRQTRNNSHVWVGCNRVVLPHRVPSERCSTGGQAPVNTAHRSIIRYK